MKTVIRVSRSEKGVCRVNGILLRNRSKWGMGNKSAFNYLLLRLFSVESANDYYAHPFEETEIIVSDRPFTNATKYKFDHEQGHGDFLIYRNCVDGDTRIFPCKNWLFKLLGCTEYPKTLYLSNTRFNVCA